MYKLLPTCTFVVVLTFLAGSVLPDRALALGGINSNYAVQFCQYFKNRAMVASRREPHSRHDYRRQNKQTKVYSADYWWRKYHECIEEHKY